MNGNKGDTTMDVESTAGNETEFRPLEHPREPPFDEDQPIECPMRVSSAVNVGEMPKENSMESPRKRMESTNMMSNEGTILKADAEPPSARKRHHNQTHGDIVITPILRNIPPPPQSNLTHELTTLHQMDSFKPNLN
ncbi:uncharacterized protein LOC116200162 [Punica granatum]|uniref:Uncharacterized protein LOC116200162 n=1 Tax=Punica granatum TaxID=22663 RepID=A0A6P8CZC7_PUNGR|nr:uncharacterized protein LOC116200162 [Punica granatum]